MTRFARIRGNNRPSSFNKNPEESTSWSDLKKPIRQENEPSEEPQEEVVVEEEPKEIEWCEFDSPKTAYNTKKIKREHDEWGTSVKGKPKRVRRRAEDDRTITVNGKEVKLTSLEGFYVTEEDADKIRLLTQQYEEQGLTEAEIKSKIIFERRKAEKYARGLMKEFHSQEKPVKKPLKRKRPEEVVSLKVNGEDVVLTRFEGFFVTENDAHKLSEMRKELTESGLGESEINLRIKAERRKAEKTLARLRRKVCFNCRESGHYLGSCPKLSSENATPGSMAGNEGICYKCGSTEHSLFQCRVPGNELKFAKCFVCNQTGHLSKSCPLNPRGLYPNGGGCKLCGDVTHLVRDCSKNLKMKQERTVYASTMNDSVEGLGDDDVPPTKQDKTSRKNKKKIVTI